MQSKNFPLGRVGAAIYLCGLLLIAGIYIFGVICSLRGLGPFGYFNLLPPVAFVTGLIEMSTNAHWLLQPLVPTMAAVVFFRPRRSVFY